jgi:hypothetical protein
MIKITVSVTVFVDPEDLLSIYLDENSLSEFVEECVSDGLETLYPSETIFNHIDIEGLT